MMKGCFFARFKGSPDNGRGFIPGTEYMLTPIATDDPQTNRMMIMLAAIGVKTGEHTVYQVNIPIVYSEYSEAESDWDGFDKERFAQIVSEYESLHSKSDAPKKPVCESEHLTTGERSTLEFATYTGLDFKNGLRHGENYRLKIETQSGMYRVYANDGSMESDLLLTYNRLSEILNNWRFIQ